MKVFKSFFVLYTIICLYSCNNFRTDTFSDHSYIYTGGERYKISEIKYKDSTYLIITINNRLVGITKK